MASTLKMCFQYNNQPNLVEGIRFLDFVLNVIYWKPDLFFGILTVQVHTKNNGDMQVTLHGLSLLWPFSNTFQFKLQHQISQETEVFWYLQHYMRLGECDRFKHHMRIRVTNQLSDTPHYWTAV